MNSRETNKLKEDKLGKTDRHKEDNNGMDRTKEDNNGTFKTKEDNNRTLKTKVGILERMERPMLKVKLGIL